MNVIKVPALENNYIWIIYNNVNECVIVDPGESIKILKILKKFNFFLQAILLTHHHYDHVAGVKELKQYFPKVKVYGPEETKYQGTNQIVKEGDHFTVLNNNKITILNLPGHTPQHIGFYFNSKLFCGDTVFSAGCGKIQDGLTQSMYSSFLKIKNLPTNTLIYSGHEYTLLNINFAYSIFPKNKFIINYRNKVIHLQKLGKTPDPTTLELELRINPFFQCNHTIIKNSIKISHEKNNTWEIFHELRKKKDVFNKMFNKQ